MDSLRSRLPAEQIYAQFDKPNYRAGDTVWFKAYIMNADFLNLSQHSGLMYVELSNDKNVMVKRLLLPVAGGLARGQLALDTGLHEGSYTIRAYTNLMRNFGERYVFRKQLYISSPDEQSWLVQSRFGVVKGDNESTDKVNVKLQFNRLDKLPLRVKDLELRLLTGKHTLYKDKFTTGPEGELETSFILPKNTSGPLVLTARELTKQADKHVLSIPVNISKQIDLQLLPEGGYLINGIETVVGFKAIDGDGKSLAVQGQIYDQNNKAITRFKSDYAGMGRFSFTPKTGETYKAVINGTDGQARSYNLPEVKVIGTALQITPDKDSVSITINKTSDIQDAGSYYLIGQSREVACDVRHVKFTGDQFSIKVPQNKFPTGIAKFTLLNTENNQPLNERMVFVNHHDGLHIDIKTNKTSYGKRDSVALHIEVTDKDGQPVQGSFSLAVTDDSQVDATAKGQTTMASYLQLTSNLQGTVETPDHYFEKDDAISLKELDNLMLTQGWTGYSWQEVFNPQAKLQYSTEKEYTVQGKVSSISKPIPGTQILLMSQKPPLLLETQTDEKGHFVFRNLVPADTAVFSIQAKNKNGKAFNVGVDVDEFKPPVFAAVKPMAPWYVNTDSTLIQNLTTARKFAKMRDTLQGKNVLKQVNITAKKIIKGSHNLNGPGEADLTLDEKDMEKAGKVTLGDLLKKYIKDFRKGADDYYIGYKHFKLIIDGVDIDKVGTPPGTIQARTDYIDSYLDFFTAEDIAGLELENNWKYNDRYNFFFLTFEQIHAQIKATKVGLDWAYVEITTRSGNGPFVKHTPGIYLFKPLALTLPKDFYRPRYVTKEKKGLPDLRSTIHWEPDLITGLDGKATVSFYTSDSAGGYSLIMEGCSMEGDIGTKIEKLRIGP